MRQFTFLCVCVYCLGSPVCVFYTCGTSQFQIRRISKAQQPHVASGDHGHSNSKQSQKCLILYRKKEAVLTSPVYFLFTVRCTLGFLTVSGHCFSTLPLTHERSRCPYLIYHKDQGPCHSLSTHNPDPSHCGPSLHSTPLQHILFSTICELLGITVELLK